MGQLSVNGEEIEQQIQRTDERIQSLAQQLISLGAEPALDSDSPAPYLSWVQTARAIEKQQLNLVQEKADLQRQAKEVERQAKEVAVKKAGALKLPFLVAVSCFLIGVFTAMLTLRICVQPARPF